jgi:hypothetical protein
MFMGSTLRLQRCKTHCRTGCKTHCSHHYLIAAKAFLVAAAALLVAVQVAAESILSELSLIGALSIWIGFLTPREAFACGACRLVA